MRATSIVAVRTTDAIFIGSDSKIINGDGGEIGTVCKILSSNGVFFSVARIWGSPTEGFNVSSFATEALNANGDLESRIAHFEELLVRPLERLLLLLKSTDSTRFQRELENQFAVDVLFVGFEADRPAMLLRSFIVRNSATHSPTVQIKREECSRDCLKALAYTTLGHHEAMDNALADNPDLWKIGFAEAIRKLIDLEISAVPNFVGPPISILRIDISGSHWIQRGACPDTGTR